MKRRQLTAAQLRTRRTELANMQATRGLVPAEAHELENLDHRFYMREWHRQQREAERAMGSARA